jgi:hypothetical protein
MKNILVLALFATSTLFGQKLTKEQLIDVMSDKTCECTSKKELTKENTELTLGLCILESIKNNEKDVEKHYGKDVVNDSEKMEKMGYDIGTKLAVKCPTIFQNIIANNEAEDAVAADEDSYEEEPDLTITGKITILKSEQFLSFSVKETTGKMNHFILLGNFENAYLLTDKVIKINDNVEVFYYEYEMFDAKLNKFVTFNVVSDIIKK